ncbi:hypothetical protein BVY00_02335 [bacterium G20]|nr:hypothetical protein BVY00_02335 [bacterium G20]
MHDTNVPQLQRVIAEGGRIAVAVNAAFATSYRPPIEALAHTSRDGVEDHTVHVYRSNETPEEVLLYMERFLQGLEEGPALPGEFGRRSPKKQKKLHSDLDTAV